MSKAAEETAMITAFRRERLNDSFTRAPIWKLENKRESLLRTIGERERGLKEKVEKESSKLPLVKEFEKVGETQATENLKGAFFFQGKAFGKEEIGLNTRENLRITAKVGGMSEVSYGFAQLGEIRPEHAQKLKGTFESFEEKMNDWVEVSDLRKLNTELKKIDQELKDELALITHRRVVPGRCKFCPV
jgi:uncharacterized protein YneR